LADRAAERVQLLIERLDHMARGHACSAPVRSLRPGRDSLMTGSGPGQRYRNRRADAELRLDVEPAAVAEHDMLDDGEAEAGAADGAAASRVDAIEALGQAGDVDGRNALALVDHADPDEIG